MTHLQEQVRLEQLKTINVNDGLVGSLNQKIKETFERGEIGEGDQMTLYTNSEEQ